MKKYGYLIFDLDGTITDTAEGITKSVEYALDKFGIKVDDRRSLFCFIGPPLVDSFMDFYGFSQEDAERATVYYREYYHDRGIFDNALYDGMSDLLRRLSGAGRKLVLATSKPEEYARRIMDHFGLTGYFHFIAGASFDSSRAQKADVLRYALEGAGIKDRSDALMIGDRFHDVNGAKEVGIDCLGVLYGFGSRDELEAAGAAYIAESVEELGRMLG